MDKYTFLIEVIFNILQYGIGFLLGTLLANRSGDKVINYRLYKGEST